MKGARQSASRASAQLELAAQNALNCRELGGQRVR